MDVKVRLGENAFTKREIKRKLKPRHTLRVNGRLVLISMAGKLFSQQTKAFVIYDSIDCSTTLRSSQVGQEVTVSHR